MDIEKLIEDLRIACAGNQHNIMGVAATALSTLQAENAQLRADLEYEREHANAYYQECGQWEAENEKLYANLARVTAERDAMIVDLQKWNVCATCKQYIPHGKKSHCKAKEAYLPGGNWAGCSKWEWRGIKED